MKVKLWKIWLELVKEYADYVRITVQKGNEDYTFKQCWHYNPVSYEIQLHKLSLWYRSQNHFRLWEHFYNYSLHLSHQGEVKYLKAVLQNFERPWISFKCRTGESKFNLDQLDWEI